MYRPHQAAPADVGTIAGIMRASYEVISGPAGAPRQWERDRTLYMPGATFVVTSKLNGKVETTIMTPEEYRRKSDARFVAQGLFETEIGWVLNGSVTWHKSGAYRFYVVRRTVPSSPAT